MFQLLASDYQSRGPARRQRPDQRGRNQIQTARIFQQAAKPLLHLTPRWWGKLARADVVLDLAGASNLLFKFRSKCATPAHHTLALPEVFTNTAPGNGIAVSADGNHWFRIASTTQDDGLSINYTKRTIDFDAAVASVGLDYGQPLHLQFQASVQSDGANFVYYDDIETAASALSFLEPKVLVAEGTYNVTARINVGNRNIESLNGPAHTILDGMDGGYSCFGCTGMPRPLGPDRSGPTPASAGHHRPNRQTTPASSARNTTFPSRPASRAKQAQTTPGRQRPAG